MRLNLKRSQKEELIASLKKDFSESNLLVVTHYSGLNVKEIEELRSEMRNESVNFKVTKNRITKLALTGTFFENSINLFKGPTAIAYSKDMIKAAKVAVNFSKKNKKLIILGGSFEGKLIDKDKVNFLASLPTLDEIRAKLIAIFNSPASKLTGILKEPGGQIFRLLKANQNNLK